MSYFITNYNAEILKDLESKESMVICSGLGSGKSTSVKKLIHKHRDLKVLLVVNKIVDQEAFKKDLPENIICVDSTSIIKLKEAVDLVSWNNFNCLCITKVRFNYMITVETTLFDEFDVIIIDESGGLNPIVYEGFESELQNILQTMGEILKLESREGMDNMKMLIDFLYDVNRQYIVKNKSTHKLLKINIDKKYSIIASKVKRILLELYNEDKMQEYKIVEVLGLFNSIIKGYIHLNEYNHVKGKKSNILYCNSFLKTFIETKHIPIKILDGTANFIQALYKWLDIPIKDNYEDNSKSHPNMKIHFYNFDDVTPFEGRTDIEIQERMLKFLEKEKIPDDFLLFTNYASTKIFNKKYTKVDYAFSGNDVGSNIYKDEKNLVIVFYNTLPQAYRIMWNKEIKGMSDIEASSALQLEIAEYELVGSMMVQLVGRTYIRQDNNAEVNIYMFCVSKPNVLSIANHYKIPRENIKIYQSTLDLRKSCTLPISGLFYAISLKMKEKDVAIDIIKIAEEYYGDKLSKSFGKDTRLNYSEQLKNMAKSNGYSYNFTPRKSWEFILECS